MKIRDANPYKHEYLKTTDLDNLFNVYLDKKQNYIFNLNNSIYFEFDKLELIQYTCLHDMHWPLISYMLYGTTRLAWLLYKLNDVSTKDIFKIKRAGELVYYLEKDKLDPIITVLNEKKA